MRRYQRRAPARDSKIIALEKAAHLARSLTCQVCGRPILASKGFIAHHGYQRPEGLGFQTSSCTGARELPFECSKAAAEKYLQALRNGRHAAKLGLKRSRNEECLITVTYLDTTAQRNAKGSFPEVRVGFSRENYDSTIAAHPLMLRYTGRVPFDHFKELDIARRRQNIGTFNSHIKAMQRRLKGWRATLSATWIDGKFSRYEPL